MHRSMRLPILVLALVHVQHTCALRLLSNTVVRVGYTCTLYCQDDDNLKHRPMELNVDENIATRLSRAIFGDDASIEMVLLPRNGLVNGTFPKVNLVIGVGWFLSDQYQKSRTGSQPVHPLQLHENANENAKAFAAVDRPVVLTWDSEAYEFLGDHMDSSKYDIMLIPSKDTVHKHEFTEALHFPFAMVANLMRNKHTFNDLIHPTKKDVARKKDFCAFMYRKCWSPEYSAASAVRSALFDAFAEKYKACTSFRSEDGSGDGCRVGIDSPAAVPTSPDENYYDSAVANYDPYKFVLVAEHSRQDGYVTEKIFNALLAGAVPIYFGAPDIETYVNPARFINCNFDISELKAQQLRNKSDFEALVNLTRTKYSVELDKCVEEVRRIDSDMSAYESILDQPAVLPGQFELESYANRIRQIYNHLQVPSY
jgi:hypothetical protein